MTQPHLAAWTTPSHRRASVVLLAAAGLLLAPATAVATHSGAHTWTQTHKLWNPSENQYFGDAMAADGNTLVAARGGGVHIFEQTPDSDWRLSQILHAPENPYADQGPWGAVDNQAFGWSLALDAEAGILAVGAPSFDVTGTITDHETDAGAVYIYEQAPNGTWQNAARFVGPINGDWNDQSGGDNDNLGPILGVSVGVDGDTVVAGAPQAVVDGTPLRGQANIYERGEDGAWTQQLQLTSPRPDAEKWDQFGQAVAIAGDQLAIGAPGEATRLGAHVGAVHLYGNSPSTWTPTTRLTPTLAQTPLTNVHPPTDTLSDAVTSLSQ